MIPISRSLTDNQTDRTDQLDLPLVSAEFSSKLQPKTPPDCSFNSDETESVKKIKEIKLQLFIDEALA